MIPTEKSSPADLQFLLDASKYLLGYRVHVAYNHYINFIGDNFLRWHSRGLIRNLLEPAPGMAQAVVLDFSALDIQTMARVLGTYYYIMSCHKAANYRLMHLFPGKQILYLRGYDFAGSLGLGGGLASGYSTPDTMRFNGVLSGLLASDACLFRILSPEEAYWENITAEEHFLRLDIDGLVQKALRPYRSFYLNASVWRARLLDLIDRMDHFIVYVSAATESVWSVSSGRFSPGCRRLRSYG